MPDVRLALLNTQQHGCKSSEAERQTSEKKTNSVGITVGSPFYHFSYLLITPLKHNNV